MLTVLTAADVDLDMDEIVVEDDNMEEDSGESADELE